MAPLHLTSTSRPTARVALAVASMATALLCNGLGQYEEAFRAAGEALKDPNDLWYAGLATVELVEAASRTGNTEQAKPALEKLVESTDASGTGWALGVQARCRALLLKGRGKNLCTKRRSSGFCPRDYASTSPARDSYMENGCGANTGRVMPAPSCELPRSCSPSSAWTASHSAPASNCEPPERSFANAQPKLDMT
jgi:hypothetical protein